MTNEAKHIYDTATNIYDKANKIEEKVGFLRKIPWWAYLLGAGTVWYLVGGSKDEKIIVVDDT